MTSNLLTLFEQACSDATPRQIAIQIGPEALSYRDLWQLVQHQASDLRSFGLQPRDHVLLHFEHQIAFIVTWFALWQLDCVPVPLEPEMPAPEVMRALDESSASWLITNAASLPHILAIDEKRCFRSSLYQSLVCYHLSPTLSAALPAEAALLFYTSGTTGMPKCVIHTHFGMRESIMSLVQALHLRVGDVVMTPLQVMLPATLGTVVLQALCSGATLQLAPSTVPRKLFAQLDAIRPQVFFAVPYLYRLLTSFAALNTAELWQQTRYCLSSSAMLDSSLFDRFYEQTRQPLRSLYCSSEIGSCTFNGSDDLQLLRQSVGTPLPGVEVQILDGNEQLCPPGEPGHLLVGGTHLAAGYFKREELQAQVFVRGQVKTGDLASIDERGAIYLHGRISDTINVSGYLINPSEVEQILHEHPAVIDALVSGQPDETFGQRVVAQVIIEQPGEAFLKEELIRFCAGKLAHYKVPKKIEFVSELLRSRYGKLKR